MKKLLTIPVFLWFLSLWGQKFESGFIYSPLMMSRISFDQPYIIFSDYTSLTIGEDKLRADFSLLSTGFFARYRNRHIYYQAEVDFFENKYRKSISDWKTLGDRYFSYSAVEIPLMAGYTINPGRIRRFSVFGGINNKLGRFRTVFFSSLTYIINEDKDYEYLAELPRKLELMDKFSYYYLTAMGGVSFTYYGLTTDIRAERNITNLNKVIFENNANYKDMFMIRLCFNIVIPSKKDKR